MSDLTFNDLPGDMVFEILSHLLKKEDLLNGISSHHQLNRPPTFDFAPGGADLSNLQIKLSSFI